MAAAVLCCCSAKAQLFSLQTRQTAGAMRFAMEFVDRYFVDLLLQKDVTIERKMMDDKVYFRQGALHDLRQITDTVPFTLDLHDRYYEVKWLRQGQPFVCLVFPAEYSLLLGMNQEQAQQSLRDYILAAKATQATPSPSGPWRLLQGNIFRLQTDTLLLASLTNATYYYNKKRPVFDADHPALSAANLFAGLLPEHDFTLQVEQSVYGLRTMQYELSLSQWLSYCREWGLKLFFAVERQDAEGILALIVAHSRELGFNHLLSVSIPTDFTTSSHTVLKTRLTPYIPMHNVKDLFKQESSKRKRIQWQ